MNNFMQMCGLTDDEWLLLDKEEILQLYKNCYDMLMGYMKAREIWGTINTPSIKEIDEWIYNAELEDAASSRGDILMFAEWLTNEIIKRNK